jgi:hypothetical protein
MQELRAAGGAKFHAARPHTAPRQPQGVRRGAQEAADAADQAAPLRLSRGVEKLKKSKEASMNSTLHRTNGHTERMQ